MAQSSSSIARIPSNVEKNAKQKLHQLLFSSFQKDSGEKLQESKSLTTLLQVYYLLALFSSWNSKQKSLFRWHWKCKEEVTEFDCIVLRRFLVGLGPHKLMLGEQNSDTQRQINYQPSCILSSFVSSLDFFTLLRKKLEKIFFFRWFCQINWGKKSFWIWNLFGRG